MTFFRYVIVIFLLYFSVANVFATENVVNVYTWAEEIPPHIIKKFENETGIKVNYSTFETNEVLFSKLRASRVPTYDVVEPSNNYVERLRHLGMLEKLDKTKLPNFTNLDPFFTHQSYDPQSEHSIPFVWGITGVFLNKNYFSTTSVYQWSDLLDNKFKNQLMFLDDAREVFAIALRMLSYSINDTNPEHIREAYLKLKQLMPNVRLFNSDAVASILIDEDAAVGMAWNGDLYKAHKENTQLAFVYPNDGFEIWVDNFAIMKNAPHRENAYQFLNFLMRSDVAAAVSMNINYSTANIAAKKLLPTEIRNNPILYPSEETLRHGEFELDMGDKTLALYEKYWEKLKMGG